jgi:peptide/nickel transport system ATP-binding protein/oligopeptide transport system ATP-binding protein
VAAGEPVVVVEELFKDFDVRRGFSRSRGAVVPAVAGVSFSIAPQETLALVGESGSGKSTVSRIVAGLVAPTSGRIRFLGNDVAPMVTSRSRDVRRGIQMVFQDPFASVNPRMRVRDVVAEPLRVNDYGSGARVEARVAELLELVKLHPTRGHQFPHELSGGERQRVCVARAIALDPRLLILDEPVSSLDVSIQAQILNLLSDLKDALGLSYLFISHDLAVVRQVADRVAVMQRGKLVEIDTTAEVFRSPQHPYTRSLLAAIPDPERRRRDPQARPTRDVARSIAGPET